jgi:hypothetical protein
MQGKTFYNAGSPLMLGVISDVTLTAENNAATASLDFPAIKAALAG